MPQIHYRANLSSALTPLTIAEAGRTVIVPGPDQNYDRRVDPEGEQKNPGIPQAMYLENVIPTAEGYQSIGFARNLSTTLGIDDLVYAFRLSDPEKPSSGIEDFIYVMFVDSSPDVYWAVGTPGIWSTTKNVIGGGFNPGSWNGIEDVSIAYVKGICYMWITSLSRLFKLSFTRGPDTLVIENITASSSIPSDTKYITGSFNYLIAVDVLGTVNWSSLTNSLDFTPSLISGAGSETPIDYQTSVVQLYSASDGFYIFTKANVIFARYTGNIRYPWKFKEVSNSGGYDGDAAYNQIARENNSSKIYTYDTSGKIYLLEAGEAAVVAPELSTFFERLRYLDSFNPSTLTFSQVPFTGTGIKTFDSHDRKIYFLLDRYVLVSIRAPSAFEAPFTHVIFYDVLLKRLGRLKISHTFIFSDEAEIYFVDNITGVTYRLLWELSTDSTTEVILEDLGVIMLGKFQYVRSRRLRLEGVEVEAVKANPAEVKKLKIYDYITQDGKNLQAAQELAVTITGELAAAPAHIDGHNHSILIKGNFALNTMQLSFVPSGRA